MPVILTVSILSILSIIAEAVVEYTTAPLGTRVPGWLKAYAGLVIGVLLCIAYKADLLLLLGLQSDYPAVGQVLTGILIGRGSNVFNDLVSRLRTIRLPAAPVDAVLPPTNAP